MRPQKPISIFPEKKSREESVSALRSAGADLDFEKYLKSELAGYYVEIAQKQTQDKERDRLSGKIEAIEKLLADIEWAKTYKVTEL